MKLRHVTAGVNRLLYRSLGGRTERRRLDGGVDLTVHRLGRGKPGTTWILLHGLANTAITWSLVARRFRRSHELLIPELTALGGTSCPHAALDVREAVTAVTELLRAEQGRRLLAPRVPIVLAGVSLGGWVALRTALAHPELVAGVALVNPAGYRDQDWDQVRDLIDVRSLAQVAGMQRALFVRQAWWLWAARPFFYQVFTQQSVRDLIARIQERDAYSAEELATLRVPSGLFWGDRDGLFPLAIGHAMAKAIPGSKLYVFAESAHATVMERPDALCEAFEDFDRSLGVTLPPSEVTRS